MKKILENVFLINTAVFKVCRFFEVRLTFFLSPGIKGLYSSLSSKHTDNLDSGHIRLILCLAKMRAFKKSWHICLFYSIFSAFIYFIFMFSSPLFFSFQLLYFPFQFVCNSYKKITKGSVESYTGCFCTQRSSSF